MVDVHKKKKKNEACCPYGQHVRDMGVDDPGQRGLTVIPCLGFGFSNFRPDWFDHPHMLSMISHGLKMHCRCTREAVSFNHEAWEQLQDGIACIRVRLYAPCPRELCLPDRRQPEVVQASMMQPRACVCISNCMQSSKTAAAVMFAASGTPCQMHLCVVQTLVLRFDLSQNQLQHKD